MAKQNEKDIATENFQKGYELAVKHSIFCRLPIRIDRSKRNGCPDYVWAIVAQNGNIKVHPTRRGEPEEWAYVLAHCMLHLGLGHFSKKIAINDLLKWNIACDCYIAKFLAEMKFGIPPKEIRGNLDSILKSEEKIFDNFLLMGIPEDLTSFGTAGINEKDMYYDAAKYWNTPSDINWEKYFSDGLSKAVNTVVGVAAGFSLSDMKDMNENSLSKKAMRWFISNFPLLGALAASFQIIEDSSICMRYDIAVAAVDASTKEIFMNPGAKLNYEEYKFVIAHELLHVGLRHYERRQGRDAYLWNIACDFVINSWLIEINLGTMPLVGALYDKELKGLSAESIYDLIVTDLRRFRKLATLGSRSMGDILNRNGDIWWTKSDGSTLDDFYKRCILEGLEYHQQSDRGFLPAGLIEEIRAMTQPPIPWDVELAQWFDHNFPPLEKVRSYSRQSRRQSSTPDIARPKWIFRPEDFDSRTFGVVLDTSGSMDRRLLAKSLGTIASYSMSRDVPFVRVIFCDADTYDQGYMEPEVIADIVKVKGRGGTVLQPAIDLLEKSQDFPKDGPILIITDGFCDKLIINREHAFLVPKGSRLPFIPKGKVFYFE